MGAGAEMTPNGDLHAFMETLPALVLCSCPHMCRSETLYTGLLSVKIETKLLEARGHRLWADLCQHIEFQKYPDISAQPLVCPCQARSELSLLGMPGFQAEVHPSHCHTWKGWRAPHVSHLFLPPSLSPPHTGPPPHLLEVGWFLKSRL